ncbi:hypothetical protein OG900_07380 [Streptomyces sp. NBC_00433]
MPAPSPATTRTSVFPAMPVPATWVPKPTREPSRSGDSASVIVAGSGVLPT